MPASYYAIPICSLFSDWCNIFFVICKLGLNKYKIIIVIINIFQSLNLATALFTVFYIERFAMEKPNVTRFLVY